MTKRKNKGKKQEAVANKPKAPKPKPSRGKCRQAATGKLTAVSRINERLPNELLAYIFATAILSLLPKEHRSFLALVCGICCRWRNVAIEASELWTTIYIHHQNHIPAAELFLKRSKMRLLDVDIKVIFGREFVQFTSGRGGYYRSPPAAFSRQSGLRVAELTSAHLGRTRMLSLSVSDAQGAERFSALYRPVSTPHLASLSVYIQGWLQSASPLLDSICSVSSNGSDGLPSNAASGFSLTRLELGAVQPEHEDMRKIFTYFPSLETLILPKFCQSWRGNQEVNRPIIFAPNSLRSLAVHLNHAHVKSSHAGNSPDCSCVLGSLCFPNLEYLEVVGDNSSWNLNLRSHFNNLPELKTLRLQRCSASPSDDTFFRSLKLLNRLELVDNLKDVKWCKNYRKRVPLPFPRLSSLLLSDNSRGGSPDMFQWARVAQLAIQNYGCTQFSIKVTAQHHSMMTRALTHQNERIQLETADHPPGLLHPLPPLTGNSFDWPDDDDYDDYYSDSDFYIDPVYGFDSSDYDNQAEYYGL
ncbi:hypothetical protein EV421DRAFT_1754487 [Armillaria borealis]|uniref:F-box domain-containing protein n=1 Tax=Armillaria borealis TaxID=47425 RepID=A0AA39K9I4_9AGAR|nr:hypothetical protein EV421DRAFT_1754487 [Armillaria borealis]